MDEVSVNVKAPAGIVYDLVADVTQMGRWSPVCTGGTWLDGATAAVPGARFKGTNKEGPARWSTTCRITDARPGEALAWQVELTGVRWGYRFEPDGEGGTIVTEWRDLSAPRALPIRLLDTVLSRTRAAAQPGMRETLERVKGAAEAAV